MYQGFLGLAVDKEDNVFYATGGLDAAGNAGWVVRKSGDAGSTWTTIDNYQSTGGSSAASAIAISPINGEMYTVGNSSIGGNYNFFIRKSSDKGTTWKDAKSYLGGAAMAYALAVAVHPTRGYAVASGFTYDGSTFRWATLISRDGGGAWEVVDRYQYGGTHAIAHNIYIKEPNTIFVVGTDSGATTWVIRKSVDGGLNWQTIYQHQYVSGQAANAYDITGDTQGNLYTIGGAKDEAGERRWQTHVSTDDGNNWTLIDDYVYTEHKHSRGKSITVDPFGNLYAAGRGTDKDGYTHWIVRKLACE